MVKGSARGYGGAMMGRMRKGGASVAFGSLAVLVLTGCGSRQSTLRPESHASRDIADLWWAMLVGSAVVVAVVTMLILIAVLRRRGRTPTQGDTRGAPRPVPPRGFL